VDWWIGGLGGKECLEWNGSGFGIEVMLERPYMLPFFAPNSERMSATSRWRRYCHALCRHDRDNVFASNGHGDSSDVVYGDVFRHFLWRWLHSPGCGVVFPRRGGERRSFHQSDCPGPTFLCTDFNLKSSPHPAASNDDSTSHSRYMQEDIMILILISCIGPTAGFHVTVLVAVSSTGYTGSSPVRFAQLTV
jgi:hypothetical protein